MSELTKRVEQAIKSYLGNECGMVLQRHALTGLSQAVIAAMQADAEPVEDRVSPPTSVDDSETGNTSYKLRDAREAAARAALEAAAKAIRATHIGGEGLAIRAIDPAQFREVR